MTDLTISYHIPGIIFLEIDPSQYNMTLNVLLIAKSSAKRFFNPFLYFIIKVVFITKKRGD